MLGVWDFDEGRVREALDFWRDFPVDAQPRPLVLTGETVLVSEGFPSDEVKQAFLGGEIEAAGSVPDEVVRALSTPRHRALVAGRSASITSAHRATAAFETDRGLRELPAWQVRVDGMDGHIFVLDPALARDAIGPEGLDGATGTEMRTRLGEDECHVVLQFLGSPPQFTDYRTAVVLESATAVAIVPVPLELVAGDRPLYAQEREMAARLAEPLGARVLVDYRNGCAVPVLSAQPVAGQPTMP